MLIIEDTDKGKIIIERNDIVIPLFHIGQTIIYSIDINGKPKKVERDIVGYSIEAMSLNGEDMHQVTYQLDNGDVICEEEVEEYYTEE